ncbi:uncharacterized protein LTR77_000208 [Saxophila tyrrhenica]|uniref:DUF2470 domain-containing protein n=1 Tax=Saxophila tyrrhenica TaxID=1690608 RepID=A0AAV9PMX9_9PEZI|nr:hypothetical protein LTR77_000208 [Saxophila tyrrhenica]
MSQPQETQDAAARNRITTHMNADHHDSIIRYLQHYAHLPLWTASNSKMTDVDLSSMTFTAGGKIHRIPFTPPLKSYRETRERVVEMDQECLAALGRSDVTVTEFVPPRGMDLVVFVVVAATLVAYGQRWWFEQGGVVEKVLGAGFAKFSWTIQPWLICGMVVIHGSELAYFVPNYLAKHSVNPRTAVWWQWAGTTFVEGVFSFWRFQELVERKRQEKMKQKH